MAPQESRRTNAPKRKEEAKKYRFISYYKTTRKWGAWIMQDPTAVNTRNRRYVGQYDSETLAARAQDRANLKWKRDAVTDLNFTESDYKEDEELREKLTHEQFRRLLVEDSHSVSNNTEPSPCWAKFLAEEEAKANRPSDRPNVNLATFAEVLEYVMEEEETPHTTRPSIENLPVDNNSQDSQVTLSLGLNASEPEGAMPGSVQTTEQSPHMLDSLAGKTRSSEQITWVAISFKEASDVDAADPIGIKSKLLSFIPISSQDNVQGEQELVGELAVQNSNKRNRLIPYSENRAVDNNSQDSDEDPVSIVTQSEGLNAPEPEGAMPGSVQTSEQSPHKLETHAWKTRHSKYFTWAADSFKEASDVLAADPMGNIGIVSKYLESGETNGTAAIVEGKEELCREPKLLPLFPIPSQDNAEGEQELGGEPTVQNSNKRKRLDTDVDRVPDTGLNGPPHEIDGNWKLDNDLEVRDSWGLFLSLGNKRKQ